MSEDQNWLAAKIIGPKKEWRAYKARVKALPAPVNGQNNNASPVTVNTATYDLWSYGEDEENINARSVETTTDNVLRNASQKWIKNW